MAVVSESKGTAIDEAALATIEYTHLSDPDTL